MDIDGIIGKIHRREPLVLWERVIVSNSAYILVTSSSIRRGTIGHHFKREGYQVHAKPLHSVRSTVRVLGFSCGEFTDLKFSKENNIIGFAFVYGLRT